ncbi:MAG TPA: GatB/YqeY domain-containing protein [Candidatus Kaiserbacteria bacterium]|nr:GatB/YqeY domain-containing protein [Candidatus Kaiserbacteria bacterium]
MLVDDIRSEMITAMKEREGVKLRVMRGLISAFTNELISQKRKSDEKLDDDSALSIIKRAVKQRLDSIEQFKVGGRDDLAETEEDELSILNTYLPETMNKEEIQKIAEAKKQELGIDDKSKIGILIGAVMSELKGKADGKDVKEVVDSLFE